MPVFARPVLVLMHPVLGSYLAEILSKVPRTGLSKTEHRRPNLYFWAFCLTTTETVVGEPCRLWWFSNNLLLYGWTKTREPRRLKSILGHDRGQWGWLCIACFFSLPATTKQNNRPPFPIDWASKWFALLFFFGSNCRLGSWRQWSPSFACSFFGLRLFCSLPPLCFVSSHDRSLVDLRCKSDVPCARARWVRRVLRRDGEIITSRVPVANESGE